MVVPILVIADHPLLDTLLCNSQVNMYLLVLSPSGGQDSQFHCVQGCPGISIGRVCQKIRCILIDHGVIGAHAPVPVIYSPVDQFLDIVLFQGL